VREKDYLVWPWVSSPLIRELVTRAERGYQRAFGALAEENYA
jgi:hypothetical protein